MLTDDDKRWLTEQLDGLGTEFGKGIDRVRVEFSERLEGVETTLIERIDRVRVEFSERSEKVETTLLTEFHKWASPIETLPAEPRRSASRPG
jgi:hypothetical protein